MSSESGTPKHITKEEVLDLLKKEQVTDLNQFVDFVIKKATGGDPKGPIIANTFVGPYFVATH